MLHHPDAEREYAYDWKSEFGRLNRALDAAAINGWTVWWAPEDSNLSTPLPCFKVVRATAGWEMGARCSPSDLNRGMPGDLSPAPLPFGLGELGATGPIRTDTVRGV